MKEVFKLWEDTPGICEEIPVIEYYKPEVKKSDAAVIIFPGGGYAHRAKHEGEGYAEFLNEHGISAFVVQYRVKPHRFPLELLDARRSVRYVRYFSDKFGIDKNKVCVMGSSAGGHLAALVSTYMDGIDFEDIDEIDKEDFLPNKQILCYPVITLGNKKITHIWSGINLLGEQYADLWEDCSPNLIAGENTPDAFIWHTFEDGAVNVINSLDYAKKLKELDKRVELHIFPDGPHGLGLAPYNPDADENANKVRKYASKWGDLLIKWFEYINYLK